ncbi:Uncharacterised protein [Klebsiella pneumoniae]|nr:Uncharacterised protein [Klebsiella pneumoniae]
MSVADLKKEMEALSRIQKEQNNQGLNLSREAMKNIRELSKRLEPYQQVNQMKSLNDLVIL